MTRRVLRGFNTEALAEIRRRNDISVNDLARVAGVSPATIFNWEAGRASPQVDLLARVMRVLNATIEQVVTIPAEERYPGDWRVLKGLTQRELALAANIPTATVRDIERADRPLNDINAIKLAQQLGISAEEYKAAYQRARQRPLGAPV